MGTREKPEPRFSGRTSTRVSEGRGGEPRYILTAVEIPLYQRKESSPSQPAVSVRGSLVTFHLQQGSPILAPASASPTILTSTTTAPTTPTTSVPTTPTTPVTPSKSATPSKPTTPSRPTTPTAPTTPTTPTATAQQTTNMQQSSNQESPRNRTTFTDAQKAVLYATFATTRYPDLQTRTNLAAQLNLSSSIKNPGRRSLCPNQDFLRMSVLGTLRTQHQKATPTTALPQTSQPRQSTDNRQAAATRTRTPSSSVSARLIPILRGGAISSVENVGAFVDLMKAANEPEDMKIMVNTLLASRAAPVQNA
ncbi:hypothetical protein BGZ94_001537 [Podila epigama]|nr:hypothetical protein BGZ94_001537 [Podila epigama]